MCPGDTGLLKADNILLMRDKHNLINPVYIGDTKMDAESCKKAGVPFVFASYGFGKVEDYAAIIESPAELLEIFKK